MRSNKKGFTIVELVIVIAVIAILAAVLIPTIAGLVKKANATADTQLVSDLNTAIAAYVNGALDGDETGIKEALAAAAEFGIDVTKINAKAEGNEILYDSVNNVFCYLNGDKIEYIPNSATKQASNADLWIIASEANDTYSTYIIGVAAGATIETSTNIDVTACENVNVKYTGNGSIKAYMNGGDLDAGAGEVELYGKASTIKGNVDAENGSYGANADTNNNAGADNAAYTYVENAAKLKEALEAKAEKIALSANIDVTAELAAGAATNYDFKITYPVEINLNGYDITSVHNFSGYSPDTSYNHGVFMVESAGELTLTGSGDVTILHTGTDMVWSATSAVIATRGDVVINGAVNVINLGGTSMSYAIDMWEWGSNTIDVTIKSGTVHSEGYRAIRLYHSSGVGYSHTLNVEGGVISAANNCALMLHGNAGNFTLNLSGGSIESNGYTSSGAERAPIAKMEGAEEITLNITGGQLLQNGVNVTDDYN